VHAIIRLRLLRLHHVRWGYAAWCAPPPATYPTLCAPQQPLARCARQLLIRDARLVVVVVAVSKPAIDYDAPPEPADAAVVLAGDDASSSTVDSTTTQQQQPQQPHEFVPDPLPLDSDGYCVSFAADAAPRDIKRFFERYGVVVLRGVLTASQTTAACAEVFAAAGLSSPPPSALPELEAIDWESAYGSRYNRSKGFVGYDAPDTPCAWAGRLAPGLIQAYRTLFSRGDLVVKLDRFGMMRPTVFEEGAPPRKDWQTTGEWIHWDHNPWLEPDFERIQGVREYGSCS
jgi:hypothetical protein